MSTDARIQQLPHTDPSKPAISRSPVLRLRGLPFLATTLDIKDFFSDFELNDVYICRRNGRSTGEAYVVLQSPEGAQNALLQLNKKHMGNRYIELFEAAEADLAAVKKVLEDSRLQGFVVRLRGLPYTATAADITVFLEGVQLAEVEDAIVLAQSVDGRPTGEAYVELADEQALSLAMTRHKELMGTRYIEVFNSSKVDKLMALQHARFHLGHGQARSRWLPRGMTGMMAAGSQPQHLLGAGVAPAYISGPGMADQLADALSATHLSPSSGHASAGSLGPACMLAHPYPGPSGSMPVSPPNSAAAAAAAAGQRFLASPAASAANSGDIRLHQLQAAAEPGAGTRAGAVAVVTAAGLPYHQLMAPGPVMVGPDGQPLYYMPHPQGMWPGQPRMVPMVPTSGAPQEPPAAMQGAAAVPGGVRALMPAEGPLPYMQPGMPQMMVPAAGMQQYTPAPYHQWAQGAGVAIRALPPSSTAAGYMYNQQGQ